MACTISYGVDSSFDLDLPPETLVAACETPHAEPLSDPAAALHEALTNPLEFPPLARATVPGDKIVLAMDGSLPQPGLLAAVLAEYLVESGAAADDLTLLRTKSNADLDIDELREQMPSPWRDLLKVEIHDPADKHQLGLLGQSHNGRPIYMNRSLLDADLVVPIGCLQPTGALGYHGRYGGLFPAFADEKTVQRYRKPRGVEARREVMGSQRRESDEIGWLLGSQFTVQVIPGGGESLVAVLAGETHQVFEQGQRQCDAAWTFQVNRPASLVVAAVSGRPALQTWENVARALASAGRLVAEGGAIALCTDLDAAPNSGVASLAQTDDWQSVLRRIRRDCPPDALVAAELIEVMGRARVYLLSQLEESLVEDLGIAPVGNIADVARLARRHESCIVLANAQRVLASTADDE